MKRFEREREEKKSMRARLVTDAGVVGLETRGSLGEMACGAGRERALPSVLTRGHFR